MGANCRDVDYAAASLLSHVRRYSAGEPQGTVKVYFHAVTPLLIRGGKGVIYPGHARVVDEDVNPS